jgi:ABC-type transport system involved in multi-copper enzyme maturation permease subunit
MSGAGVVLAAASADFLERVRRYSFLFTLGLAVYFGYMATVGRLTLRVGDSRGIYNSAWVGGLLAVVGSTFISLAGFYFVKNTLQRDRETRVGEILAATPISRWAYILGKFASNFAVLAAMIGILALFSMVMQLVGGEDMQIHLLKLLSPFLFLSLPAMAVIAALALVFETIPFLRGGFGNVTYFFLWTALLTAPALTNSPLFDLSGLFLVQQSIIASHAAPAAENNFSFSLDIGQLKPAAAFRWEGIPWTGEVLVSRLALFGVALLLCLLAAALFDRFDPARGYRTRRAVPAPEVPLAAALPVAPPATGTKLSRLVIAAEGFHFPAVLKAELRLMLKGQHWWWYAIAAGLLLAPALIPNADARGMVLAVAWIWPVLLWSPMGMREMRYQTHQILFAAPHPMARQLPAVWFAGVLLAAVTGSGFALRLLLERNLPGLFAWAIGALFIPTAALCLGVWSSSSKPFEILYTLLWYVGPMHGLPAFDFMGSSPATAATRYPLMYLTITTVLFVLAIAGRKRQLLI